MAEKKLRSHVHVHDLDKDGNVTGTQVYGPDDKIPADVAKRLGDHVWESDASDAPAGNASLEAWQDYALSQGATSSQVDGKTRAELREQFGA